MINRVAAILYVLTALATLNAGLASFRFIHGLLSIHPRWAAPLAVFYFAAPTIFFLAGVSAFWKDEQLKASKWITAGVVLLGLTLFFVHRGFGWRPFAEAAGPLLSVVFILGSFAIRSSKNAVIGTVIYAASQGDELFLNLRMYWAFGGSYRYLLAAIATPILVLASVVMALKLDVKAGARDAQVRLDGAPDSVELRPPE